MKKFVYGVLIAIVAALVGINLAATASGTPFLTYVYSESMLPLIRVHDAFFVLPTRSWQVGDIVTYRPVTLPAKYITHRIIAVGETGYITKGDNAPYTDQASGEPELKPERMVGKVVTVFGKPLVLRGLGNISETASKNLGSFAPVLAGILVAAGVLLAFSGQLFPRRKRRSRRRWRLRHVYRLVGLLAAGLVIVSVLAGSRLTQVRYLVSENPGSVSERVALNQPGYQTVNVRNMGILPAWPIAEGLGDLAVGKVPTIIWPFTTQTIQLTTAPRSEIGWYQDYVRINQYPVLFPRIILETLTRYNRLLALAATGLAVFFWYSLFFRLMNRIPGLGGWVPLKAIRDKIAARRLQRAKARILGRRRIRS